jgi:hypothetical protein
MSFSTIQAMYAAHNVVTYPLSASKAPAVKCYNRVGAQGSAQLARKFADATAAGFVAGRRNRLTVVDIDSHDHRLVDECLARFGVTPLQVVTPSGGRHLYYRHNGEARRIRPLPDVDILGAGNVVAAGSKTPKGRYQIERGSLQDLDRLPRLAASPAPPQAHALIPEGKRNATLFNYCRSVVGHCDTLDQLLDAARTWATSRLETGADPVSDAEVIKTCTSVWRFRAGRKLFMQHIVESPVFDRLIASPDVWTLCSYLMIENGPKAKFMIADGLGEARGWPRRLVPACRKALLDMGVVRCVRPPRKGAPGLYRWSTNDLPELVGNPHSPLSPHVGT